MEYFFHLQDPNSSGTLYLFEAIVSQVQRGNLKKWKGFFSFATGAAVRSLFCDEPEIKAFLANSSGSVELLIGIDAITNETALKEFEELSKLYENFTVKVFFNPSQGLFHPKASHFLYEDGLSVIIVGSGNLTEGGLRKNIEAYSIIENTDSDKFISVWNDFCSKNNDYISEINQEAYDIVKRNIAIIRKKKAQEKLGEEIVEEIEEELDELQDSRVLVGQIPKGGTRWQQLHYNQDVIHKFFKISPGTAERLFLQSVSIEGLLGEEEVRPVVYSKINKNYKIETALCRGAPYPSSPPIVVMKEVGVRSFRYMLLMPGDSGYDKMRELTEDEESVGRGMPRVIVHLSDIKRKWPECPL